MEMRKIAAIAERHDVMVAPHNPMGLVATAINVHFAAATYNFLILEFVPHESGRVSEFVRDPWIPKDGYLDIPDKPGWGIAETRIARTTVPPSYSQPSFADRDEGESATSYAPNQAPNAP